MAREEKGSDKGRVKVRVIEFEMEGSNQTLRESIRDIVGAIGKGQIQRSQIAAVKSTASNGIALDQEPLTEEQAVEEQEVSSDDTSPTPKRPRILRTPQVLDDLDLNTGPMSLKDFLEKLSLPVSDLQRNAAIAYWLKSVRKLDEISADHIHTGYKRMKWPTPADASSPLRQLKAPTYGWVSKGSKPGTYKINHVGEGHVEALMIKAVVEL